MAEKKLMLRLNTMLKTRGFERIQETHARTMWVKGRTAVIRYNTNSSYYHKTGYQLIAIIYDDNSSEAITWDLTKEAKERIMTIVDKL